MTTHPTGVGKTAATLAAVLFALLASGPLERPEESRRLLVQAGSAAEAAEVVRAAGGVVTHELGLIDAVGAQLTHRQLERLRASGFEGRVYPDRAVQAAARPGSDGGGTSKSPPVVRLVGADRLHDVNIDGRGVGIAFVDTGHFDYPALNELPTGRRRLVAMYDAILDQELSGTQNTDESGHGAHVASIGVESTNFGSSKDPDYRGVAPKANLVVVRAFDAQGRGTYADVIRGIDWLVQKRDWYYIRVLNLSFSAPVNSWYWEDPLNQAVMRAWEAGLVVVVSAGNGGPGAMTMGVPGNVPYVITVGAITDNYTPEDLTDDRLASFSSTGPTYEGFVKPDVVAPGGHIHGLMSKTAMIAQIYPEYHDGGSYFTMSGTSQSAAVVTGVAALVVQYDPSYTPDDVKCALMASARVAVRDDGTTPYSVFQQGAGLIDAWDAVFAGYGGCANGGLDVTKDLAGIEHYAGPAAQDEAGNYYLLDESGEGTTWDGSAGGSDGYPWSNGYPWSSGYPWSNGYPWTNGYAWSNGYPWSSGYVWHAGLAEPASINVWVSQE